MRARHKAGLYSDAVPGLGTHNGRYRTSAYGLDSVRKPRA